MTDLEKEAIKQMQQDLFETIDIINKFCKVMACSFCPFNSDKWECTIEKYLR